jgi:hypothetical protein
MPVARWSPRYRVSARDIGAGLCRYPRLIANVPPCCCRSKGLVTP